MPERKWMIISADGQFWSNHYGWCANKHVASAFNDKEQAAYLLPPQGTWREINAQDKEK